MNVNVKYLDLPCTIKAMTVRECSDDEWYTVVLNSRMTHETHLESYKHETAHILNDDFHSNLSADQIESMRHK